MAKLQAKAVLGKQVALHQVLEACPSLSTATSYKMVMALMVVVLRVEQ